MAEKQFHIKVTKNAEEEENRKRYKETKEVARKWKSILRNVNDHGEEDSYKYHLRQAYIQAFNLAELVMTNFIEEFIYQQHELGKVTVEKKQVPGQKYPQTFYHIEGVPGADINLYQEMGYGFRGKSALVERFGVVLPADLDAARDFRNKTEHSTETQAIARESKYDKYTIYKDVEKYILTLGKLLVAMGKLEKEQLHLPYEALRLEEGECLGYLKEYKLEKLVKEDQTKRVFQGMKLEMGNKVEIIEFLPKPNMTAVYASYKEKMLNARGGGLARTDEVIFQCKAVYAVREVIEGSSLEAYLSKHSSSREREDLCAQIQRIYKTVNQTKGIYSDFLLEQFVVDRSGQVWLVDYRPDGGLITKDQLEEVLSVVRGGEAAPEAAPNPVAEADLVYRRISDDVLADLLEEVEVPTPVEEPKPVKEPDVAPGPEVVPEPQQEPEPRVVSVREVSDHKIEILSTEDREQKTNPNDWGKVVLTALGCALFACVIWFLTRM